MQIYYWIFPYLLWDEAVEPSGVMAEFLDDLLLPMRFLQHPNFRTRYNTTMATIITANAAPAAQPNDEDLQKK